MTIAPWLWNGGEEKTTPIKSAAIPSRGHPRFVARGLMALVWLYQKTLSPVLPAVFGPSCGCRFYPTCSHYAVEAFRTRGAWTGSWLTLRRLLRCTPLHPGGFDFVPPVSRPSSSRRCTRVSA